MFRQYNPNPAQSRVGDCVIRAISMATDQDWEHTYIDLALQGLIMHDMPSSDSVWGAYLRERGFVKKAIPADCPQCYTIENFCADHPHGVYVVKADNHVVTVSEGDAYDTWDSTAEPVIYYWERT